MSSEPVIGIGAVFTSLEVAVVAAITVIALQLGMSGELTAAWVGLGSAVTIAVGDTFKYVLTRSRVSPSSPLGRLDE